MPPWYCVGMRPPSYIPIFVYKGIDIMIEIYTDGAAIPNPGNMGCGIVLVYGEHTKEISEHIGHGTNNVAELTAIKIGLQNITNRTFPITVFSDSMYAVKILTGEWKPKENIDLVNDIKRLISYFDDVKIKWVRGHAGNKYNERADCLADNAAIKIPIC